MRDTDRPSSPDPFDVEVGARIKRYRVARHLSLAALAQAAGVSFQQVQKYEQGANRISASMLRRIADRLDVGAAWLFGESLDADVAPETLALLRTPGAAALLEAFAAMRDPAARVALLRLAQAAGPGGLTRPDAPRADPRAEPKSFLEDWQEGLPAAE